MIIEPKSLNLKETLFMPPFTGHSGYLTDFNRGILQVFFYH